MTFSEHPFACWFSHSLSVSILTAIAPFTMASVAPAASSSHGDKRPDSRRLADFAAKAAETFVSAYYAASDSPQRTHLVPTLYLATSSIVWNGTPVSGKQELEVMLNSMPGSKHEVNAFDCHALGGAVDGGKSGQKQPHPHFLESSRGVSSPLSLDMRRCSEDCTTLFAIERQPLRSLHSSTAAAVSAAALSAAGVGETDGRGHRGENDHSRGPACSQRSAVSIAESRFSSCWIRRFP